jgi:hypothetical protein
MHACPAIAQLIRNGGAQLILQRVTSMGSIEGPALMTHLSVGLLAFRSTATVCLPVHHQNGTH